MNDILNLITDVQVALDGNIHLVLKKELTENESNSITNLLVHLSRNLCKKECVDSSILEL